LHNQPKNHYKIGTRGSLLALTQCNQVKDELEKLTGDTFELIEIKTQGDLITNAPLWQLEGKDFFTKELDEALLSGQVDLVVHSYKDLGSIRPEGIVLAAVTKRQFAFDIMLTKKSTIAELKNKKEFVVGTSSPRRIVNLENHFGNYLPISEGTPVTTKILRGNVNTRIQKLRDGQFDAIVLALPGLERLALTESSRLQLETLLEGMNFMVLPQSIFPSSAAQGALGIECAKDRKDLGALFLKLQKMQDQNTLDEVSRERLAFNQYGGGCHLAVGVNVKKVHQYFLHTHLGRLDDKSVKVSTLEGTERPHFFVKPSVFNGLAADDLLVKKVPLVGVDVSSHPHLYVTGKHCLDKVVTQPKSLWASGTKTLKDLTKRGFWVNGCADGLGDAEIKNLRNSKAIALMIDTEAPLSVLSNDQAKSTLGEVIPCYTRVIEEKTDKNFEERINNTDVFYWTSFFQYRAYVEKFPQIQNRIHATGLGITFKQFNDNNISVFPMAGMEEFKTWINL
jgi:hydroxymethylbilane synthase